MPTPELPNWPAGADLKQLISIQGSLVPALEIAPLQRRFGRSSERVACKDCPAPSHTVNARPLCAWKMLLRTHPPRTPFFTPVQSLPNLRCLPNGSSYTAARLKLCRMSYGDRP